MDIQKSKIKYIKGNLFDTDRIIIAHSTNCSGGFGSGVAGQIAKIYPEVRLAYFEKYRTTGWRLGDVQFVEITPNRIISNMATQKTYGKTGKHVDYPACYQCFLTLFKYAEETGFDVAIPMIGAGLGGGEWSKIEEQLLKAIRDRCLEIDIYYL